MRLVLPTTAEPMGSLTLDVQPEKTYRFRTVICPDPLCECEQVDLEFVPDAQDPNQTERMQICADLQKKRLETLSPADEQTELLTTALSAEIQEGEWEALRAFYCEAKSFYTRTADLDTLNVPFPPEAVGGMSVGFSEVLPYASDFSCTCKDEVWEVTDQYCVAPGCVCHAAVLEYWPVRSVHQSDEITLKASANLLYDYRTGTIETTKQSMVNAEEAEALVRALQQSNPDLNALLATRHSKMRQLFRHFLQRNSLLPPTSPPGRNDPCPCGSGKKYKKCCGV